MTRTLPWLESKVQETGPSPSRTTTRPRVGNSTSEATDPPFTQDVNRAGRRVQAARTPSTSPPPLPPPNHSPLRPGLDRDDIYIMVEDEFLATAQIFTRHLHRAEYQRLKHDARTRNASTITNISRPTDSTTKMREELRLQKRGNEGGARIRKGMGQISAQAKGRPHNQDSSTSESNLELDSDNEVWQGTHLDAFKGKAPKNDLKSLTGLHKPKSHTRAAAGYNKPEKRSLNRHHLGPKMDSVVIGDEVAEEDDEDTDDLDQPIFIKREVSSRLERMPPVQRRLSPEPARRTEKTCSNKNLYKSKGETSSGLAPRDTGPADKAASIREKVKARREREERQRRDMSRGDGDSNVREEIPMF